MLTWNELKIDTNCNFLAEKVDLVDKVTTNIMNGPCRLLVESSRLIDNVATIIIIKLLMLTFMLVFVCDSVCVFGLCLCLCLSVHVCFYMWICLCLCLCMYVYIYNCLCLYVYVCIYAEPILA